MTTPTPDGRPSRAPRPAPPYRYGPVQPPYPPQGHPVYPGYGPPYEEWPEERVNDGRILRSVLILAGVAGVVTVLVGLLLMMVAPEQYGLADQRTTLPPRSQANATGLPDPYFQAPATAPPPLPSIPAAPAMQPSTPVRLVVKRLGINAPISSVGLDGQVDLTSPDSIRTNCQKKFAKSSHRCRCACRAFGPCAANPPNRPPCGKCRISRLASWRRGSSTCWVRLPGSR